MLSHDINFKLYVHLYTFTGRKKLYIYFISDAKFCYSGDFGSKKKNKGRWIIKYSTGEVIYETYNSIE